MLHVDRSDETPGTASERGAARPLRVGSASMAGLLRKNRLLTACLVLGATGLGLAYARTSTPLFTSTSDILIDARRAHVDDANSGNRSLAELGMDTASIDSQVAVLDSEGLAVAVLKRLHLEHEAAFAEPTTVPGQLIDRLHHWLAPRPDEDARNGVPSDILEGFMKALQVRRVQQTYVISLSFTDRSPDRAAAIVNTVSDLYQNEQIRSSFEAHERMAAWLKDRTTAVRQEIAAAEQALVSYQVEVSQGLAPSATAVPTAEDRLHDLKRDLDAKKTLYEALVDKSNAALQQQTLPVSSVSIISAGRVPPRKSAPNVPLILALSALSGLAVAAAIATLRELATETLRLPSEIESALQLRSLGVLPRLAARFRRTALPPIAGARWGTGRRWPALGQASKHPRSLFAETMRAGKAAVDQGGHRDELAVIGVVSALPGEGRSTVAANLAETVAAAGRRVLLIDADLSRPMVSRACAPQREAGLVEVLAHQASLDEAVVRSAWAGVDLLPAAAASSSALPMLEGADVQLLLGTLEGRYDTVVIDLPPLVSFTAVSGLAPLIDRFLLVVGWATTGTEIVVEAMHTAPLVGERTAGVILNRVDLRRLRRMSRSPRDLLLFAGADRLRRKPA